MPAEPTLGQIMPVAFYSPDRVPKGWHLCDGSLMSITQNMALFSLLETRYGGDGRSTFGLPDLRGRAILGTQNATQGLQQGAPTVTVTEQQMPNHNHFFTASTTVSTSRGSNPANNMFGVNSNANNLFALAGNAEVALVNGTNVLPNGGSQPHNNMQPYLAINYLIAVQGVFPSRL